MAPMAIPNLAQVESGLAVFEADAVAGTVAVGNTDASVDVATSSVVELVIAVVAAVAAAVVLMIINSGPEIVSAVSEKLRPEGRNRNTQ